MALKGVEALEGVGGDILNPRNGGGAYEDMLRALHDAVSVHERTADWNDRVMLLTDYYRHLGGIVAGADDRSYADLFRLAWSRNDEQAQDGVFEAAKIYGSSPLYQLAIDIRGGFASVIDHEQQVMRRRVGQNMLLNMTEGVTVTDDGNYPDYRYLANGYAIVPYVNTVDIRAQKTHSITGDTVRRALDPYESQLAAIALSLSVEAARSTVIKQVSTDEPDPVRAAQLRIDRRLTDRYRQDRQHALDGRES